jgi:hypothetical protein
MLIIKHRSALQMSKIPSQNWKPKMSCTTSEAQDVSDILNAVLRDRLHEGRTRATHSIARELGMKPSRVAKFIRKEIARVWADEYRAVRDLHENWLDRKMAAMSHDMAMLEARRSARKGCE